MSGAGGAALASGPSTRAATLPGVSHLQHRAAPAMRTEPNGRRRGAVGPGAPVLAPGAGPALL